jgi:DNA-3-methyladenine glycosylase
MRAARLERAVARAAPQGPQAMERARRAMAVVPDRRLAAGLGLVCTAFSIDRADDGLDLCDLSASLHLELVAGDQPVPIKTGPRIGIDYAPEPWRSMPWRYYVPGNSAISAPTARARPEAAR